MKYQNRKNHYLTLNEKYTGQGEEDKQWEEKITSTTFEH
jgi:hypothetical protein